MKFPQTLPPGIRDALDIIEHQKARFVLASELHDIHQLATELADSIDPDDELHSSIADELTGRLGKLLPTQEEMAIIAQCGFALEASPLTEQMMTPLPKLEVVK